LLVAQFLCLGYELANITGGIDQDSRSFESFGLAEVQAVEMVVLLAACLAVTQKNWMMKLVVLINVVGCDQEDPIVVGPNRVVRYRRFESPLGSEQ
jgi:hypothetical protein